jgi:dihydrofolate reductase
VARVVLRFSMSLDGYVAGPEVSARSPMGVGGDRLHEWMFPPNKQVDPADAAEAAASVEAFGAVIVGRRTFDLGFVHWNDDTPYPAPSFVLTHNPRPDLPTKSASFRFVTDGVESVVRQAKEAADSKDVIVMGAEAAQQILRAGLADALQIQVVSVLLAGGTRLFDKIGDAHIELVRTRVVAASPDVTHFDFNVINQA